MIMRYLVLCLMAITPITAHSKTVTITTGEYPPWTGAALQNNGYVNHIISEAFASVGMETTFIYMPWKRAFEEAKQGKYDATSYWLINTERRAAMILSEAVIQNRTVFFQRSDDKPIQWTKLSDLAPYRMSATLGFTYTEDFIQAVTEQTLQVIMVPNDIQNIKMLMSKRVDIFATDEMSGFYMAATLSVDPRKLRVIEPELNKTNGYLMASKLKPESAELMENFNRGLQLIKANGTYDKILNRIDNSSFYNPKIMGE